MQPLDRQTLEDERDAKVDIYNYAARYDSIPQISVKQTRRLRSRGGKLRKVVEVTVGLRDQNITATGRGENLKSAEIAAAIQFKQAAEKYQSEQGNDVLVVRDSSALNTTNVRNFIEYYKIVTPGARIDVEFSELTEHKSLGSIPNVAKVLINGTPVGEPVAMIEKKNAETLAYLTAAIAMKKENPQLFTQFSTALRSSNGDILRPLRPIDMPVDADCVHMMQETLLSVRRAGLPDEQDNLPPDQPLFERRARYRKRLTSEEVTRRSQHLATAYKQYQQKPELEELRKKREELPMYQHRAKVIDIVENNTYSIIIGATGSGKTTQVPQILLEEAIKSGTAGSCNIICTQPRRIAATSVAKRVANERAEQLQESVGYHVRFDAKIPQLGGSITYCTTGILLQQLQHSPDEVLNDTTHLIIDEVHERDLLIDFLLIILKKVLVQRSKLGQTTPKVVLMSATIDDELFSSYFKNADTGKPCPALSVPGRAFPVQEVHLESLMDTLHDKYSDRQLATMRSDIMTKAYQDVEKKFSQANSPLASSLEANASQGNESVINWKEERKISADGVTIVSNDQENALVPLGLVATTIAHIVNTTNEGAILVFLPGLEEMIKVEEMLCRSGIFGIDFQDQSKFTRYMLHSSISTGQTEVFNRVPAGCRKIILATNIAETSITIPEVQYVVDSGKLREKQYNQLSRISKLQCTWISKSNSKQRAGRAGRVQNGYYYALFTKTRYNSMRAVGLPEMLRADLQDTCLDIKAQAFKVPIREFLAEAIEPPAPKAVDASVLNLQALDALTGDEQITPLGRLLASMPVHPALGKMIVLGIIFRCLDPMLLLGAAAGERGIFINPLERRREASAARMSFVLGTGSDHMAFLNAMREMRRIRDNDGVSAMFDFARENFIHIGAFRSVDSAAQQIESILEDAGLVPTTSFVSRGHSEFGHPSLNENSHRTGLIKALVLAGVHPNLAACAGGRTFRTPGEKGALIHPSSVNVPKEKADQERFKYGTLLSYSTLSSANDSKTIFLRDTTESTPLMVTLFGGRLQISTDSDSSNSSPRIIEVDNWLPFYVQSQNSRAVKTILEFRKALERLLTGAFGDLSKRRALADDPVREMFAEGLVDVLQRDVRTSEATLRKGWGRDRGEVERKWRFG